MSTTCTTILVDARTQLSELPAASPRWAIIRARRAIASGRAVRAYLCRNTRGQRGCITSGKVVRYADGMSTDRHLVLAPHYDRLFIAP